MKIKLLGKARVLKERIESQGDEVVSERESLELGEPGPPQVCLAPEVLKMMDLPRGEGGFYTLSRWLGQDWHQQILLQVHATKFMAGDLGTDAFMGSVGRFFEAGEVKTEEVFESESVRAVFSSGWVTVWFSEGVVSRVHAGLPYYGWCHMAEHVPGRLGETFDKFEEYLVPPNFVGGSLLTRWPWPEKEGALHEKVHVDGLAPGVTRHLWNLGISGEARTAWTDQVLLAYATGWGEDPRTASSRATTTCKNVVIPLKQYRSDLPWYFRTKWEETAPLVVCEV